MKIIFYFIFFCIFHGKFVFNLQLYITGLEIKSEDFLEENYSFLGNKDRKKKTPFKIKQEIKRKKTYKIKKEIGIKDRVEKSVKIVISHFVL